MPDFFNGPSPFQGQPPLPDFAQQPRHRGGKHQNRQRRGERAPFSADGPVFDRSKSTIVVENIPEENFNEGQVKDFFSQFGEVLEVSMQPYKRLAIVKFDSWNAASAAYQSPKVIFDNRFVKVFWYKDDGSTLPASAPMAGGAPGAKKAHRANGSSTADGHDAGPQPEIDMEEFAKQQEEKQRAFEEKTKRREELERQREDLEKRQKELIAKQLEEKAKLEAKLGGHNGTKSENGDSDPRKPMSQTEALRAQLAALEAEARQMGLDPDAIDAPSPWAPRGGYGRGRGSWRGSSSPYTPRGLFRGSSRGRANVHAAYAAYSLDNRPKKVVLTGVDFTASDKDETLRQYLFVSPFPSFTSPQPLILNPTRASASSPTFRPPQPRPRSPSKTAKPPRNFSTRSSSPTRNSPASTPSSSPGPATPPTAPRPPPPRAVVVSTPQQQQQQPPDSTPPSAAAPAQTRSAPGKRPPPMVMTAMTTTTTTTPQRKTRTRQEQQQGMLAAIRTCTFCWSGRPGTTTTTTTPITITISSSNLISITIIIGAGISRIWTMRLRMRSSGGISNTAAVSLSVSAKSLTLGAGSGGRGLRRAVWRN
jgi:RNA recognition motif-containing protein